MSNSDTHRELHELFNGRDFDAITKRFADTFRYVDHPQNVTLDSAEAFKGWLSVWTTGMSNARVTDATYVDGGDTSVALFTGRGTHDGQFGPLPPTGKDLAFALCEVMRYDRDGNVTGGEIYYDTNSIAAQAAGPASLVVRNVGEGEALWMLGGLYEVLVSGEETGGMATVMQMTVPAGMGPPPHIHAGAEVLRVIEGTLTHHTGDNAVDLGPGAVVSIPAGTLEWFEPTNFAKVQVTYMPGGIDRFFAEAGERAQQREVPPPPTSPPDVERLTAIGARYGLTIAAPPDA